MEIRSFTNLGAPKVNDRNIKGYAVVFNHESRVLFDKISKRFFVEVIKPTAITSDLIASCDIKATIEHNRQRMIARSVNGVGSLSLGLDEYGMSYSLQSPNTLDGNYAVEMIERGDIFGSSFAFFTDEKNVTYEKRGDILVRTIHKIDALFDVSIVADPAYFGTDVTVRHIDDVLLGLNQPDNEYKNELNNLRRLIN